MKDGCEERDSMERGVEATSQKTGRVRLGGRGRAVIKNVGESSLESSSVISPSLPLPFARSLPPSLKFFMPRRAWTSKRNWITHAYLWACWTSEFSAAQLHLTNIAAGYFMLIWVHQPLHPCWWFSSHLSHFSTGSMLQKASKNKSKVSLQSLFLQPYIHTHDVFGLEASFAYFFWHILTCSELLFCFVFQLAHHTAFTWESNSTPQNQTTCTRSSPGQLRNTFGFFQLICIVFTVDSYLFSHISVVFCFCIHHETIELKSLFRLFSFSDICLSYSWSKTSSVESGYLLYHNCSLSHAQSLFFPLFLWKITLKDVVFIEEQ